jgi:hypothetical protein
MLNFKNYLALIVLLSIGSALSGQNKFANEWINPSKKYYKIKVAENGIYKVTYEELVAAGLPQGTIDGSALKLVNIGKEQAIHVSNNNFGSGAWFEFYGVKNTIGVDSLLFRDWKKDLLNPDYSFITDTNTYFLTLSPETVNLRYNQINPDFTNNTLTPLPYYIHEEKVVYTHTYFKNVDFDVRYSQFEPSEGFASGTLQKSDTKLNISGYVNTGPDPILEFRTGQNNRASVLEIRWNGVLKDKKSTNPKLTTQHRFVLNKNELLTSNTLNLNNVNTSDDRHIIANALVKFPRIFDFGNKSSYEFKLAASSGRRMLDIASFDTENKSVILYDVANHFRYNTRNTAGKIQAILNGTINESHLVLVNTGSGTKNVASISVFTPKTFENKGQQYVIITTKSLQPSGQNAVKEYVDYRSSNVGGGYKTDVLDMQDIYDHFAYGIDRHFIGIKHLSAYMKVTWPDVKFVMLLGKGVEYPYMRSENDVINNTDRIFYVPTYGYIGSDNMLFSEGNFPDPYFAVGRIAARTPDDIRNYLDKVREYEQAPFKPQTIEDKYWMKRVMNLGGGKNDGEQNAIRSGLEGMATLLKDTIYGADVWAYYKRSTGAISFNENEEINILFENGVSFVNFFGHSSAGTWEFSIDNPRNYDNFGKYPFINSFGCYSGNLHGTSRGISESFVLEKNRGSIGFLASTGTAFIPALTNYGARFYHMLIKDRRYPTFGEVIRYIAEQNRTSQFSDLALFSQLTLHGDPAIKPYLFNGPDYVFEGKTAATKPANIQAALKEYQAELNVANIGIHRNDSLEMVFYHELPNGKVVDTIYVKESGIGNSKKITIPLKNHGLASVGKNKLRAIIDPKNVIAELPAPDAESNNELFTNNQKGFEFFVSDNFATAIYPPDFAMINNRDHFILKASTSSVPIAKGNFVFQIDTTAYFNSPLRETGKVESEGGLIQYTPRLLLVPDRVYYWRVSPDSVPGQGYKWSQASFAFLPNEEEGWNQSHFFQFAQNEFLDLEISEETGRQFQFGNENIPVKLINKIWDESEQPGYIFSGNNFNSFKPWRFMDAGIAMVVNNTNNMWHLFNQNPGLHGSFYPVFNMRDTWAFKTSTPSERKTAIDFIESQVDKGKILSFFTILSNPNADFKPQDWGADSLLFGKSLFTVLEKLGAKKIRQLQSKGSVPYILQAINDKTGVLSEEIAENKFATLEKTSPYPIKKFDGGMQSILLPKVKSFSNLQFKISTLNQNIATSNILIKEKQNNGLFLSRDSTKISPTSLSKFNENISFSFVNFNKDTRISNQLDFWRVSYNPLPDAAISFVKTEPNLSSNEIKQGEKIKIFYDVTNVNYVAMDSIQVKYSYITGENQSITAYKKIGKLGIGQKISDFIEFTIGAGNLTDVRMIIEINPDNHQPELNLFNNTLTKQFGVQRDQTNPLLDIYFDGVRIMDGDIVSPKPEILITLEDDNTFLPVTDPNLFEIKLDTGRNQVLTIPVSSPQIKFTPAGGNNKTAKIQYYPTLKEGEYKLVVQAKDASGNKSGVNPRSVNFKVIEKQSISNVLNYPNPFSTSTQFVFTLTGAEVPEIMSISIMTLSGKVVRDITKEELGPLRIGLNRTEYRWDGTDEYGSKLGNGVYLYKVNTRKKDKSTYDQFGQNETDKYFKEGFGKMVILR